MNNVKIVAQTEGEKKTAEVYLYGEFGDPYSPEMTDRGFIDQLDALGPLDEITVRINSIGGSVVAAHGIYNALVRSKARIVVEVDGLAGSAGSYVMMAGHDVGIAENALVMVHRAAGGCLGNCNDMRDMAETLELMDKTISSMYASRTNRKQETWISMMDQETWFDAESAVKNRLANRIIKNRGPSNELDADTIKAIEYQASGDAFERGFKTALLHVRDPPPHSGSCSTEART